MPRIDEIAYRQLKATPTERELSTLTLDGRLLVQQHTTGKSQRGYILTPCCYPEEEDV